MAGTGLPIPKDRDVLPQPTNVIGAGVYSNAQSWLNIADSARQEANAAREQAVAAEKIGQVGAAFGAQVNDFAKQEMRRAQIAAIADFEVSWREKKNAARDQFTLDPEGFKKWADESTAGAVQQVPGWMLPHAKQFLSREFEGAHGAILGERRAQDKRLEGQALTARIKLADDDVMSIASATGGLNSPEGIAAVATYKGVVDSAAESGIIASEQAQLLTEDLTTRSQGAIIRKSVEGVYREKGFEAAREHLSQTLDSFGAPYRITDKIRTQTLGWLRSEESGLRGERDAIGKEWGEAKKNLALLSPDAVADLQQRAYSVGAMKVGDDIQAHASALNIVKTIRGLPQSDQVRILATGNIDARLAQRESGGDPTKVNQFGYAGTYQFGAPRVADLGVYTPGQGENLAAWSKTPANAPGKWTGQFNIPGFPQVKTLEDFKANPDAQKAVYRLHNERMDQEIDRLGLGQYVGQQIGGTEITRDGLKAMIHLAGADGARQTLASGGRINPADANGTTALDYARLGAGDLTGSRAGQIAIGMVRKDLSQDLTRKIADMQSAVNKTEFPPMEEIGALGAQVHLLGNEEQKRQVAEMAAQAEYGAKFVQLPQAQRDEIVGRWKQKLKEGATQYERKIADTVIAADKRVAEAWKSDPYEAAAQFTQGLPALPAIDWSSPSAGQVLAAKVSVQNTIRADQGLEAFSVLRAGEAQQLAQTLVSGDPRQGSAIINMMAQQLPADMYRATISSPPIRAALDGMVRSYDPERLNTAMSVMDRAWRDDPLGFKQAFKEDTLKRLQTWQAMKDFRSPIEMAAHFQRADDPAFAAARTALEKEADKKLGTVTPASISNELGSVADRWVPFVNQAPPADALSAARLSEEYGDLFRERYVATQDVDKAKAQTVERLKTIWGPSAAAGGTLMRHPPERYYPQVDGSHDWMKRDLEASIAASRYGEMNAPDRPEVLFGRDISYKLISDQRTEADVAAKRAPSYVVQVTDPTGRPMIPLDFEGKPMRFAFDPKTAQEAARTRFGENRAAEDPFSGPVGELGF
jgi:hypothetical protein